MIWVNPIKMAPYVYSTDNYHNSIVCDTFCNVYLTGWFKDTMQYQGVFLYSEGIDNYNSYIMKVDKDGNLVWITHLSGIEGNYSRSITIDNDNNLYVTGRFRGTAWFGEQSITSYGLDDVFIAKLHEDPLSIEQAQISKRELQIKIFPNPNNGNMEIEYCLPGRDEGKLTFYSIDGKSVAEYDLKPSNRRAFINASEVFSNGIYYYRFVTGKTIIAIDKLVIVK
ncbi:MAG: T9SS type A sorting domain-containing protein [Bacteroidia bacterium]|nr:T9SS type A sorting domain-containing protein [Bacteroidia bacterium]